MTYVTDHAGALVDVTDAGAAVTFTQTVPGTYDAATDTWSSPSTATVTGSAVRTRGDPQRYIALELVQSEAPTLVFAPTTYGELPALGATVTWNEIVYTVKDVEPVAPDGIAIIAKVIVAR